MIRYTTPALEFDVEAVDLTENLDVYVSLEQGCVELEKKNADLTMTAVTHDNITDTHIVAVLTQEESAKFSFKSPVRIQVNYIGSDGIRGATEQKTIPVMENLLDRVIAYGD